MASNLRNAAVPKTFGPNGTQLPHCVFTTSGTTADVTTVEAQGCTVARFGVGTYVITLGKTYKNVTTTFSVLSTTTAQVFIKTAQTGNSVTIKQVTAGGGTAVDTLVATVDVIMVARANS